MPKRTAYQQPAAPIPAIVLQAEWHPGPRTAAWDALWSRILRDVLPQLAGVAAFNDGGQRHE